MLTLAAAAAAAAAAGVVSCLQLHGSVVRALRAVVRREGVAGLYRGVGAVAWGAG
jgi:hypothetical protein